jgi:hypothetical protein
VLLDIRSLRISLSSPARAGKIHCSLHGDAEQYSVVGPNVASNKKQGA